MVANGVAQKLLTILTKLTQFRTDFVDSFS